MDNGDELLSALSRNLRSLRKRRGVSQLALAMTAELSHNTINDIENGKRWVSAKSLSRLAAALGVAPYELLLPEPRDRQGEVDDGRYATFYSDLSEAVLSAMDDVKRKYSK